MAFEQKTWVNVPVGETAPVDAPTICAENFNRIEQGIADAHTKNTETNKKIDDGFEEISKTYLPLYGGTMLGDIYKNNNKDDNNLYITKEYIRELIDYINNNTTLGLTGRHIEKYYISQLNDADIIYNQYTDNTNTLIYSYSGRPDSHTQSFSTQWDRFSQLFIRPITYKTNEILSISFSGRVKIAADNIRGSRIVINSCSLECGDNIYQGSINGNNVYFESSDFTLDGADKKFILKVSGTSDFSSDTVGARVPCEIHISEMCYRYGEKDIIKFN